MIPAILQQLNSPMMGQIQQAVQLAKGNPMALMQGPQYQQAMNLIQRSVDGGTRTKVYFCHPYCSSERGTNENQNRFVRRWLPKGTMFDKLTPEIVQALEDWINSYPRKLLGWMTSEELFQDGLHSCINVV